VEWLIEHLREVLVISIVGGLTIFEIAPIKVNPWSWIFKKIGRAFNREVLERMDKMEAKVDGLDKKVDAIEAADAERDAINARVRILRFGDEVLHGQQHSKEHFDQTLSDITNYNEYCRSHPDFQNEMTVLTAEQIKRVYVERWKKHDFK